MLLALVLVPLLLVAVPLKIARADDPPTIPSTLVLIKGIATGPDQPVDCFTAGPGVTGEFWGEMQHFLQSRYGSPYSKLDALQTYDNDTGCTGDIRKWGPSGYAIDPPMDLDERLFPGFNLETPIERLSYHTAWYLYWNYWQQGKTVDIAAHSMGGIIVRDMMASIYVRYYTSNPYPPISSVRIRKIVTVGTPHAGVCGAWALAAFSKQAGELACQSNYMVALESAAAVGKAAGDAEWFTYGSDTDEVLGIGDTRSAVGFSLAQHRGMYGTPPAYTHGGMLEDESLAKDAAFTWFSDEPAASKCQPDANPRSLRLAVDFLLSGPNVTPGADLCKLEPSTPSPSATPAPSSTAASTPAPSEGRPEPSPSDPLLPQCQPVINQTDEGIVTIGVLDSRCSYGEGPGNGWWTTVLTRPTSEDASRTESCTKHYSFPFSLTRQPLTVTMTEFAPPWGVIQRSASLRFGNGDAGQVITWQPYFYHPAGPVVRRETVSLRYVGTIRPTTPEVCIPN
jgi:hypothetical protein